MHRDYHSRNLMFIPEGAPGILDYQDALLGPISYDLVSFLKDAYIEWDEDFILDQLSTTDISDCLNQSVESLIESKYKGE